MKKLSLIVATLLIFVSSGCQPKTPSPTPTAAQNSPGKRVTSDPSQGEASPKFNLTAPDGSTVTFDPAKNPDKEVSLLLFWSYRWDPNHKALLDRTSELHERYAPRGLNIIAVSYDEGPDGLRKFLAKNPVPFEIAVGADSTYESFKIESIPTAILVDIDGKVAERWTGYYTTEELAETISSHLPGRHGNSEP